MLLLLPGETEVVLPADEAALFVVLLPFFEEADGRADGSLFTASLSNELCGLELLRGDSAELVPELAVSGLPWALAEADELLVISEITGGSCVGILTVNAPFPIITAVVISATAPTVDAAAAILLRRTALFCRTILLFSKTEAAIS